MDLKQLQYFVVSVESGSFKKAAEMLYTTQPHISKSIKALETELDVQILERKARGVEVTEAGKKIYEYACNMLVDAAKIHAVEEEEERVLHVASAAGDRFAALVGSYCEMRLEEGLKVWYQDSTVEELFQALHHHTIDAGFFYADQRRMTSYLQMIERKHLKFIAICQTEPFLYVGPKNPLYHAKIVTERDLRTLQYVQSQNAYVMPEMHLMEGGMDSLYYQNQGQIVVTNNRSLLTHMLRTTALANVSSGLFPDILTGQGDIHAIPIQGMKDSITFGYVKRLRGDLPEEAVKFVEYVKKHL
ncbi:LysR family transcriptional regulator [Clostridiaceae bacterium OM08-6BH]|nr:LysR family transcriptional regulator [Clostridiaceae bacterium OM08-6BH]